ncbi:coil containing protein [Vibrio phage 1.031.O._10N.261.46.F8]|nr:coil containing protein [Vibrio phage 1.031.O._10N.261.46.F8]
MQKFEQNKWLVTADVHIHDYHPHNLGDDPQFRLKQFLKLADRLVDLAVKNNCSGTIIAGDLIQVPVIKPHIQHVVWEFMKRLSAHGPTFISLGNHDVDSKNQSMESTMSIVPLLNDLPNVHFLDREVIEIAGKSVGFSPWVPEHNLEWYEGKIDVLVNHYTMAGDAFGGQTIDNTRFGTMIFGDIHKSSRHGNIVSIGNPIGHRLGDQQDGKVIILDMNGIEGVEKSEGISWDWVDVIEPGVWDFLRIYRPDRAPVNAGEYAYDVCVPYPIPKDRRDQGELVNALDVGQVMREKAELVGLTDLHIEMESEAKKRDLLQDPVDLNFEMVSLDIQNYRSIENARLDWRGGVTLVAGSIGSGKTSIIRALEYALKGDRNVRNQERNTMKKGEYLAVDLVIIYGGQHIRINRGPGWCWYWIGDQQQVTLDSYVPEDSPEYYERVAAGGTNESSKALGEALEFMNHWNLMYINQFSNGLFASMNENQRIDMLAKILGWQSVQAFNQVASSRLKEIGYEKVDLENRIVTQEAQISVIEDMGLSYDTTDYDSITAGITTEVKSHNDKLAKSDEYKRVVAQRDVKVAEGEQLRNAVPPTHEGIPEGTAQPTIEEIDTILGTRDADITVVNGYISELNTQESTIKSEETAAHTKIVSLTSEMNTITTNKNSIGTLIDQVVPKQTAIRDQNTRVDEARSNLDKYDAPKCPTCNQDVHDPSAMQSARITQEAVLSRESEKMTTLAIELGTLQKQIAEQSSIDYDAQLVRKKAELDAQWTIITNGNTEIQEIDKLRSSHRETISEHKALKSKDSTYRWKLLAYSTGQDKLSVIDGEVQAIQTQLDAMVDVPSDEEVVAIKSKLVELQQEIGSVQAKKSQAVQNNSQLDKLKGFHEKLREMQSSLEDAKILVEPLESYIELTSNSGVVVRSILETCAEMLSNEKLMVKTTKELRGGDVRPDLTLSMKVGKKWVDYNNLSGGQLFVSDIRFLLSIIEVAGGTGLLILDEAFKFLSPSHIDELADEIEVCKARDVIVVTHNDNYPQCNRIVRAVLDEDGISRYTEVLNG